MSNFLQNNQFYQELLYIQQTEMAAPSQGSYLTPAGHIMPAYSGRGRPPLNPQHSTVVCSLSFFIVPIISKIKNILDILRPIFFHLFSAYATAAFNSTGTK